MNGKGFGGRIELCKPNRRHRIRNVKQFVRFPAMLDRFWRHLSGKLIAGADNRQASLVHAADYFFFFVLFFLAGFFFFLAGFFFFGACARPSTPGMPFT